MGKEPGLLRSTCLIPGRDPGISVVILNLCSIKREFVIVQGKTISPRSLLRIQPDNISAGFCAL